MVAANLTTTEMITRQMGTYQERLGQFIFDIVAYAVFCSATQLNELADACENVKCPDVCDDEDAVLYRGIGKALREYVEACVASDYKLIDE